MSRHRRTTWITLALCVLILAPRLPRLGQFVTPDERKWLARSANFYYAITHADFAQTFQREHPGVTVMWAGTLGFLTRYPDYVREAPGYFGWKYEEIEPFLREHGYQPLELLVAGRLFVVLFITVALLFAFFFLRRPLGDAPAALAVALVALSPFHVGLSRVLHLDALLSAFMLASLGASLAYVLDGHRRRDLVLAGVFAGLAWLTKSPGLFLIPVVGLIMLWDAWRAGTSPRVVWRLALGRGLTWGLVGVAVVGVLWPAMWVTPIESVARVLGTATTYAEKGHLNPTYFMRRIYESDPGWLFYPVNYLWRETPVVLLGLFLAVVMAARRRGILARFEGRVVAFWLVLAAGLFALLMTLGAKKFDRYLLPAFPFMATLAALGWWSVLEPVFARRPRGAPLLLGALLMAQAVGTIATYPYYLSYYNPLLGGARRAPEVMLIGWGEGLDAAARYLNAKPNAEQMRVTAWYMDGPFSYYFVGEPMPIRFNANVTNILQWLSTDYVVTYANQWQRGLPSQEMLDYFAKQQPEHVVVIDGLEYARIYDVRNAPPPDYLAVGRPRFTDWGGKIRLIAYKLPTHVEPGETFVATFYLQNIAPIERDLNVLVRIVGADGRELVRDEGWPWGAPTSQWALRDVWPDGHELTIPADAPPGLYRVELMFYDPQTFEHLPAVDVKTGAPIGDTLVVDVLQVGTPSPPAHVLTPAPQIGTLAVLQGWDLTDAAGMPIQTLPAGTTVQVRLHWKALSTTETSFKGFVHLLGPDGTLLTQDDQIPLDGFLPTTLWQPGQVIVDTYTLTLPDTMPAGAYTLLAGLYDEATLQRLPVQQNGTTVGDAVQLGIIERAP